MALLSHGPERIDPAVAKELIKGAEVVDLRKAAGCSHDHGASILEACEYIDERKKPSHMGPPAPEVVAPQGAVSEESKDPSAGGSSAALEDPDALLVPGLPSWAKSGPLVPADPNLRIQHAPNLSTRDRPTVPEEDKVAKPLLSRFVLRERLDLYSTAELAAIAMARVRALGVGLAPEAANALARASRGTPRELVALLLMARDEAQVSLGRADGAVITPAIAEKTLRSRGIDRFGLWEIERKILFALHAKGSAVGLHTLADLLGENWRAIRDVHEPFLLRDGWLVRTSKGRILTDRARQVVLFGLDSVRKQPDQA